MRNTGHKDLKAASDKLARMMRAAFTAGTRAAQDESYAHSLGKDFDMKAAREEALKQIALKEMPR